MFPVVWENQSCDTFSWFSRNYCLWSFGTQNPILKVWSFFSAKNTGFFLPTETHRFSTFFSWNWPTLEQSSFTVLKESCFYIFLAARMRIERRLRLPGVRRGGKCLLEWHQLLQGGPEIEEFILSLSWVATLRQKQQTRRCPTQCYAMLEYHLAEQQHTQIYPNPPLSQGPEYPCSLWWHRKDSW